MAVIKRHDKTFEVDDEMAPIVRELNKLGLETTSCCSGHGKSMAQLAFKVEDAAIYIHQGRISINWWRNKKSK